ncbi:acetyltransferase [Ferruginibacter sp.]|jgi:sugar O-acyltransferase (sialic acid O-acetyltransferase NeuD family)
MILIGYSGHAFVVYGIINATGNKITGYCDTEQKQYNPFNLVYIGKEDSGGAADAFKKDDFFIAIGDNKIRERIQFTMSEKGLFPINAIHPSATIDPSAIIEESGVMIAANATINPLAKISLGVICNTGCIIEHECFVGAFSHIGPGAVLCGNVTIGHRSFVGAGAVIRQGVTVGSNVIIGAGAVVLKDVPDDTTVIGVPAK